MSPAPQGWQPREAGLCRARRPVGSCPSARRERNEQKGTDVRPEGTATSGQGKLLGGGTCFTRGLGLSSEGALWKSGRPSPGHAAAACAPPGSVPAVGAPGAPVGLTCGVHPPRVAARAFPCPPPAPRSRAHVSPGAPSWGASGAHTFTEPVAAAEENDCLCSSALLRAAVVCLTVPNAGT